MFGQVLVQKASIRLRILPVLFFTCLSLSVADTTHASSDSTARPNVVRPSEVHPLILDLMDNALIARVWEIIHPDSVPLPGTYQILLSSGPVVLPQDQEATGECHLLRNGTEVGSFDRATWEVTASLFAKENGQGWTSSSGGGNRQDVPLIWKAVRFNRKNLLAWAEWPAGLSVDMGSSISALPAGKPQTQRDIDIAWSQKLYRHYLLALDVHRAQFGGGLTSAGSTAFWGDAYWTGGVSAGVPGLKYTLSLAHQPLPEFFWLESRNSFAKPGNLAHTFDAKLGYLRYGLYVDPDAYGMPIQTVDLDELPAPFGTWGTGLVIASSHLATRFWLDIPNFAWTLRRPATYPSQFRFAFLHINLAYRSIRNFNLGVSLRIHIDNLILNLPGA